MIKLTIESVDGIFMFYGTGADGVAFTGTADDFLTAAALGWECSKAHAPNEREREDEEQST